MHRMGFTPQVNVGSVPRSVLRTVLAVRVVLRRVSYLGGGGGRNPDLHTDKKVTPVTLGSAQRVSLT